MTTAEHLFQLAKMAAEPKKAELIRGLNDALSDEFAAVRMYTLGAALITGPQRPALAEYLAEEAPDELKHAGLDADKIVALGGAPKVEHREVDFSPVSNKHIFEVVMAAEEKAVRNYTKLIKLAEEIEDRGTVVQLENILADEQTHMEDTAKILADWK